MSIAHASANPQPLRIRWYTESDSCVPSQGCAPLGLDGPWHALAMGVNADSYLSANPSVQAQRLVLLVPTVFRGTYVVDKSAGGTYDAASSVLASRSPHSRNGTSGLSIPLNEARNYTTYNESLVLDSPGTYLQLNVTLHAMSSYVKTMPNGTNFASTEGRFGLGPLNYDPNDHEEEEVPRPLDLLRSQGRISSRFFSLHLGSVALKQDPSLVLGGYEQNRALGPVARFRNGIFLRDVFLGVERGENIYSGGTQGRLNGSSSASMWHPPIPDGRGAKRTRDQGGPAGSAVANLETAFPYIFLPTGVCESIAKEIPVFWRNDIKFYIWNTSDPAYQRLVHSPAYLGFIFSDDEANNQTIKLPFALLNLTLEPPISEQPMAYFPCQSGENDFWQLGRAFLQGIFMGMNFDNNLTYMAQAPGPYHQQQSVLHMVDPDDASILSDPADMFATTWEPHWQISPNMDHDNDHDHDSSSRLSAGAIAGIVVGSVLLCLVAMMTAVVFWKRQRKSKHHQKASQTKDKSPATAEVPGSDTCHELVARNTFHELASPDVPQESTASRSTSLMVSYTS